MCFGRPWLLWVVYQTLNVHGGSNAPLSTKYRVVVAAVAAAVGAAVPLVAGGSTVAQGVRWEVLVSWICQVGNWSRMILDHKKCTPGGVNCDPMTELEIAAVAVAVIVVAVDKVDGHDLQMMLSAPGAGDMAH